MIVRPRNGLRLGSARQSLSSSYVNMATSRSRPNPAVSSASTTAKAQKISCPARPGASATGRCCHDSRSAPTTCPMHRPPGHVVGMELKEEVVLPS